MSLSITSVPLSPVPSASAAPSPVEVCETILTLPAWRDVPADEMPVFAESRNHQGTTGNPYPCRVVTDVDREHREMRPFRCIRLENQYLRLEILPELGGRIYSALDKRTGYDFLYKQHVLKPALIGFLGSWSSGGCEFNWPCHHRPSTFMPVDTCIEREPGGAVTVWLGENEPQNRTFGRVGVRLAPGEAVFDTLVRLYNRTPLRHSFLWWENAAVPVNEHYRLFFPPDVHYVRYHYRRSSTTFPIAQGEYNGVRMPKPVDISWHKNSGKPTSYFSAASRYDFFGGYDEALRCGVVHVADHNLSQGKKMFTWGYGKMEKAWETALTDTDGMYAELMAGAYTTDQPDFNWLQPYEAKSWRQSWYPVGGMGIPSAASHAAALRVGGRELTLQVTQGLEGAQLELDGAVLPLPALAPDRLYTVALEHGAPKALRLMKDGLCLLAYTSADEGEHELPPALPGMPAFAELKTAEDFYLAGVHADQYRDPAIRAHAYFEAGLEKFPEDTRLLLAEARDLYAKGRAAEALPLAERAWRNLTRWNWRPESGEVPYTLGLITESLGRPAEAMAWYARACWQQDAAERAFTRMALLSLRTGDPARAEEYGRRALPENEAAQTALALALRRLHRPAEAKAVLFALQKTDPLCRAAGLLLGTEPGVRRLSDAAQSALDLAEELEAAGEAGLAARVLAGVPAPTCTTVLAARLLGRDAPGSDAEAAGPLPAALPVGIAYPSRPLERRALEAQLAAVPNDGRAQLLLGCWYYANEQYTQAEALFAAASQNAPADYLPLRCRAVALYTHLGRQQEALALLRRARALAPAEPRLLWETVAVMARLGVSPAERIAEIDSFGPGCPNDVWLQRVGALNEQGDYAAALDTLLRRRYVPCEGGEGAVTGQYLFANFALGVQALAAGDVQAACGRFAEGGELPESLGAGLWDDVQLVPFRYAQALCLRRLGRAAEAEPLFEEILARTNAAGWPLLPVVQARILQLRGQTAEAEQRLAARSAELERAAAVVDPGWYSTSAFFNSFIDAPARLRAADCAWQNAMVAAARGDRAAAVRLLGESLAGEPENLWARLALRVLSAPGTPGLL